MPFTEDDPRFGIPKVNFGRKNDRNKPFAETLTLAGKKLLSMPINRRTIAKLAGLLVIITVLLGMSYKNFYNSSKNMVEYNYLAFMNVALSDLRTDLYAVAYNSNLYSLSHDSQNIEQMRDFSAQAAKRITAIGNYLDNEADQALLTNLSKELTQMNSLFLQLERASLTSQALNYTFEHEAEDVLKYMSGLHEQAWAEHDYELARAVSEIHDYFFAAHTNLLKYMQSQSPEAHGHIRISLKECLNQTADLARRGEKTSKGAQYSALYYAMKLYAGAAQKVQSNELNVAFSILSAQTLLTQLFETSAHLSNSINQKMTAHASKSRADNASAQILILLLGGIGLPLSIALALSIVMSLSKGLAEVSKFAQQLAGGNFDARIRVSEKGKIGLLVDSLQQIPEILQTMQTHTDRLVSEIATGKFRNRLDEHAFPGSFSHIAAAINKVCESYVSALDSVPSTLFTCDSGMTVLFSNKAGKDLTNRNSVNTKFYDFFSAASNKTFSEYGLQALRKDGVYSGEEIIFPSNNKMNVQLTTRSIKDSAKNIVGFLGLILDLTEIRRRELVMFTVAGKARVIAERLAEAASRISGQVEHIAARAEEQRKRINYAAMAMSQMNDAIWEVAQNAEIAAVRAENTYACAAQGSSLVNRTTKEINSLREMSVSVDSSLLEVKNRNESIAVTVSGINEIFRQTENYSAAGAGGSAIARDLEENIASMQKALSRHAREVENAKLRVGNLSELALAAEKSLQEIVALATDSSSVAVSIASAAEEQSNTSMRIHPVMDSINSIAAEAAENAASVSESLQNLAHITSDLREIMQSLK